MTRSRKLLTVTVLAGVVALGACGGADESERPALSSTDHSDTDVAFASDMLQHHAQALAMVDLVRERPLDAEVEQLAEQIRAAQGPEIETFSDWLTDWDEEIPPTVRDHVHAGHGDSDPSEVMEGMEGMEGMEHGEMPGMMTADDFAALEDASDADFQDRWLELMIEHHEGAVAMAEAQQAEGTFRPAVELAGQIVESQRAEIETMQDLLAP